MTTVIVSGAVANKPLNGGNAWVILSWLRGFRHLGLDVYFLEQIQRVNCVDTDGKVSPFENSVNLAYFRKVMDEFGLAKSAALMLEGGEQIHGPTYADLLDLAEGADLLVNITGHLSIDQIKGRVRKRAYLDLDPGFTQFWHASGNDGARLEGHDYYFTIGENVGNADCPIPVGDIRWRKVRQPVVMKDWTVTGTSPGDRFTTIGSWRGPYGAVRFGNDTYGTKVHEFRKFIELPRLVPHAFELALDIHSSEEKDLKGLRANGWRLVDPKIVAPDPEAFRSYVQSSAAEFSAAQGAYVGTRSGWFSDRTVRYLASGKPALVQDTGFARHYPVGDGLIAFRTLDEAAQGAERIAANYSAHCRGARQLVEEYFDSDKVLTKFLDEVGVVP